MSIWDEALDDDVWLVGISGRLEQTQTPQLEETLNRLLEENHTRLVIDMGDVSYINSGGLRCLVTAWRHAKQQGGNLLLCCLTPRVKDVFQMVGFDKVFHIYPSRTKALQAWAQTEQ